MSERLCPDCRIELAPIRLLDQMGDQGHGGMTYAAPTAKRNAWTGRYPIEGSINGYLCRECGRVMLYAVLPSDSLPVPAKGAAGERLQLPLPADGEQERG